MVHRLKCKATMARWRQFVNDPTLIICRIEGLLVILVGVGLALWALAI